MTPTEAYKFAVSKIVELWESGIEVTVKPTHSRTDKELVEKVSKEPGRIPPELWNCFSFKNIDESQNTKIFEMGNYLGLCGISFDTGGCCGSRDWELDFSFQYTQGEENWEWRNAREDLEDTIKNWENEK